MKKKIIVLFLIIISLSLIFVIIKRYQGVTATFDGLPSLVMIDNKLYQGRGKGKDINNGQTSPTGTIKKIIENKIPEENEQANFGEVGMEYWLTDDKQYPLKIKLDDKILDFEYIEIDENGNAKNFD